MSKINIDTVLQIQKPDGAWTHERGPNVLTYFELDVLYLLLFHQQQCPGYRQGDIRQAVERFAELAVQYWNEHHQDVLQSHPHNTLAAAATFGLLQQLLPDLLTDDRQWTDIFSTRRFYQTEKVECDER